MEQIERTSDVTEPGSTRDAILDAAEFLFGERGYNGVSIRDVAAQAEVTLGSIPYYFSTKANLLKQVFLRRVTPIQDERRVRIQHVLDEAAGAAPDIRKVLEAFLEPAFQQSRANASYRRLAGRASTDPSPEVRKVISEIYSRDTMILPKILRMALPHLTDEEVYWRYYCLYGVVQYLQADVGKIQTVAGEQFDTSDPKVIMKFAVPFLMAGLLAKSTAE